MHHMLVIGSYVGEPCPNMRFGPKNTVSLVTVYCEIVYSIVTMNTVHTHTHTHVSGGTQRYTPGAWEARLVSN